MSALSSPQDGKEKILIVTDAWHPQINGVVRTYEHLGESLRALGHEVKVIGPVDFPRRMPMPGYREIELVILPYHRLARMIEDFGPTAIHIATEGPLGRAARRYCLRHKLPFVTAYHTQFPAYVADRIGKIFPPLKEWARRKTDDMIRRFHEPAEAIIITTKSLEDELRARGYQTPLHIVHRGVPTNIFFPAISEKFADLEGPIALYVGRVAIEKNLEDFLDMDWAGSKVVVGEGPSLEMLRQKYPDTVFTGAKTGEDLADHYRSADIFVFPSRTDTFGIVLLEAMACGLPVAAYDVTGPRDILREDFLGATHEDDLHRASMDALAQTGEEERRFCYIRENYSWDTAAAEFLDIMRRHR